MHAKERQRLRDQLIAMRDRLRGEIQRMSETVCSDAQAPGEHDHAVSEAVDKELVLERAEEDLRGQIALALQRFDDGSYGMCLSCGHAIADARLEAVPYASYCVQCQQQREAGLSKTSP